MAIFLNDLVLLIAFSRHPKTRTILKYFGLAIVGIPAIAASIVAIAIMLLGLYSIVIALLSEGNASSLFINIVGWISLTFFGSWILLFKASK